MSDGSTVTIERTFVWCGACRAVGWGEQLADAAELQRELTAIEAREPSIVEEFSVLVDRHTSLEQVLSNHVRELGARIAWRRIRTSPARCLECGSTDILPLQRSETNSGNDKWTLAEHPDCAGVITVLEELTLTLDRRWIRYSPEGERRQAYDMYPHKGAVPIDAA